MKLPRYPIISTTASVLTLPCILWPVTTYGARQLERTPFTSHSSFEYTAIVTPGDSALDVPVPSPTDVQRICEASFEASKSIWRATAGQHLIEKVVFNYYPNNDVVIPQSILDEKDFTWYTHADVIPHVDGTRNLYMSFYEQRCRLEYVNEGGEPTPKPYCQAPLSPSHSDWVPECRCEDAGLPVPSIDIQKLGHSLAHEIGHSVYDLDDEYRPREQGYAPGYWICADENNDTSMMGTGEASLWCDEDTHLRSRTIVDRNGNPIDFGGGEAKSANIIHGTNCYSRYFDGVMPIGDCREETPVDLGSASVWEFLLMIQVHHFDDNHQMEFNSDSYPGDPYPFPTVPPDFCEWIIDGTSEIHDSLIVVDRSGSMQYTDESFDGPTGLEQALNQARQLYNYAEDDAKVGVWAFNTTMQEMIEYETKDSDADLDLMLTPSGATDLCLAVRDGADIIGAAGGTPNGGGHQMLLTDVRPTAAGCDSEELVDAVLDACDESRSVPVTTHVMGYGDVDEILLLRMQRACPNRLADVLFAPVIDVGTDDWQTQPIALRMSMSRLGAQTRGELELAAVDDKVWDPREDRFEVPAHTESIRVEWHGDGFRWIGPPGAPSAPAPKICTFLGLGFELEAPDGTLYNVGDRPVAGEADYLSRSITIDAPDAGEWTARIVPLDADFICFGGNSNPVWGEYDPRIGMIATARHAALHPIVELDRYIAARNSAVKIEGQLQWRDGFRLADIDVQAEIAQVRGAFNQTLSLKDDGVGADAVAGDAIYTGVFNASTNVRDAGPYRVNTKFKSTSAASTWVVEFDEHADSGPGVVPPNAEVRHEVAFALEDCVNASTRRGVDQCDGVQVVPDHDSDSDPTDSDSCGYDLEPGQSYSNLEFEVVGLPLTEKSLRVRLTGTGVEVDNVRLISHNSSTRVSRILFDATVHSNASAQNRALIVHHAGVLVSSHACDETDIIPDLPQDCYDHPSVERCCLPGQHVSEGGVLGDFLYEVGAPNPDCIFGYGGQDSIHSSSGADFIAGGDLGDFIVSGGGRDIILGEGGEDAIHAGSGDDEVFGGPGEDFLVGEAGNDHLRGDEGNDDLSGGEGEDTLEGGTGNDILNGDAGNDTLFPGPGADTVYAGKGHDRVVLRHACEYSSSKRLYGGSGTDTLVLPGTLSEYLAAGGVQSGFEVIIENDASDGAASECH